MDRTRASADRASVYVLKMGQPARIVDLATRMIRMAGFEPGRDMEIVFTGIRRGERLNEYLFTGDEPVVDIGVAGVTAARAAGYERARVTRWLETLAGAVATQDRAEADRVFAEAIPSFARLVKEKAGGVVVDLQTARQQGEERAASLGGDAGVGFAGGARP